MKNKWKVLSGILCAAFLCTACSGGDTEKVQIGKYEEQEYQPKLDVLKPSAYGSVSGLKMNPGSYISIIGKDNSSEFWKSVEDGAKQAVADINKVMGYKGEDKVRVVYSAPGKEEDVDEQVNILDEELSRNPAALGIAVIDADACEVQFDLAADNGIPVVLYDSGSVYQNAVSMIGTDNKEAGKTAGNKIGDALDGSGKVALFMQDSKSTSSVQREEGIREAIVESYENIEVADSYHSDELEQRIKALAQQKAIEAAAEEVKAEKEAEKAGDSDNPEDKDKKDSTKSAAIEEIEKMTELDMIKYILENTPELTGCIAGNERMTKLVMQAVEELGLDDLKIIGFDGGKKMLEAVQKDKIEGLVIQNPYGMGYATVVAAARAALHEPNEANVDSGYVWVTKDNLKDENIQKMLY